jgi:ribulose-phosphate 3-epimerase
MKKRYISVSMMCADFLNIQRELDTFAQGGVDYLHIDIMDGHFVPNLTLGPGFCKALAEYSSIPLDIHLMVEQPDHLIPQFSGFKDAIITIHPEATYHPHRSIQLIQSHGITAGIALNPTTTLESIRYLLPDIGAILLMTVNPGFAGQRLIPQTLDKIRHFSDHIEKENLDILLEVDGNVSWENLPKMKAAGADAFTAGTSSIFQKNSDRLENIKRFRAMIDEE